MASVAVTYLEMTKREMLCPKIINDEHFKILEATVKQREVNKFLYEFVGSKWKWRDKFIWTDTEWKEYAESENLRTFIAYYDGSPAGYFELKLEHNEVEIAYFGLAPKFIGKGYGGALLTKAIETAWEMNPSRIWLHTCSLDHPAALNNYQARGMTVYKVEHHEV